MHLSTPYSGGALTWPSIVEVSNTSTHTYMYLRFGEYSFYGSSNDCFDD